MQTGVSDTSIARLFIFSGYVLFNLFLFVFHVISVSADNVIFCK